MSELGINLILVEFAFRHPLIVTDQLVLFVTFST